MATLQKFKLLATQCAIAGSPSRSPTTSPVFQLRRRKTLRMLLTRSSGGRRLPRREESPDQRRIANDPSEKSKGLLSNKLKDLFVSSPPLEDNNKVSEKIRGNTEGFSSVMMMNRSGGSVSRCGGIGSPRHASGAFRNRLIRRAWRPVLGTIPE